MGTLVSGAALAVGGVLLLALDSRLGAGCDEPGNLASCREILRTQTPGVALAAGGASLIGGGILLVLLR